MITSVSRAYGEVMNLCNLAKHHKKICNESDCGVSLSHLKITTQRLVNYAAPNEIPELEKMINETEWI